MPASLNSVLALAGALAAKKHIPISDGTLPTHTPLFVGLLIGVVLIVGALTFVPSLALSTDNAAMIAAAGLRKLRAGMTSPLDINADAALAL